MTDELELRAQARIGRVLNEKWTLERLLGVGGMTAVYAARHRNGAKAAVKVLHPEFFADEDVRQRFLHEGRAANKVEHPNAVQVLDDDVVKGDGQGDEGTAYLVMELLEGESLLSYARNLGRSVPEAEVLAVADQVLEVLEAAHAHGIIHRDLKPENLFLVRAPSSPEGLRLKVLDFGIARIADGGGKTRVGTALGTPTYMAPEQAAGRRNEIDGRTDLFALGATMWRLLTGLRIHDAPSGAEILAKMATMRAPKIRSLAPAISAPMAAIIDRALEFDRDARYPDAAAMRRDVRAAIEGRPLAAPRADAPHFAAAVDERTTFGDEQRTIVERNAERAVAGAPEIAAELPRTNDHAKVPPVAAPSSPVVVGKPRPRRLALVIGGVALLVLVPLGAFIFYASTNDPAPKGDSSSSANAGVSSSGAHDPASGDDDSSDDPGDDDDDHTAGTTGAVASDPTSSDGGGSQHGVAPKPPKKKKLVEPPKFPLGSLPPSALPSKSIGSTVPPPPPPSISVTAPKTAQPKANGKGSGSKKPK